MSKLITGMAAKEWFDRGLYLAQKAELKQANEAIGESTNGKVYHKAFQLEIDNDKLKAVNKVLLDALEGLKIYLDESTCASCEDLGYTHLKVLIDQAFEALNQA